MRPGSALIWAIVCLLTDAVSPLFPLVGRDHQGQNGNMRNPRPPVTGTSGAGLVLVTWLLSPEHFPPVLRSGLIALGFGLMAWGAITWFVQAFRHVRERGTSMVPVIGMAVCLLGAAAFGIWYYVENSQQSETQVAEHSGPIGGEGGMASANNGGRAIGGAGGPAATVGVGGKGGDARAGGIR